MLGHLRTKTLDAFKDAFEKALARGDGFAVASRECTEAFLAKFDKGCEGMLFNLSEIEAIILFHQMINGFLVWFLSPAFHHCTTCFHLTESNCFLYRYRSPNI